MLAGFAGIKSEGVLIVANGVKRGFLVAFLLIAAPALLDAQSSSPTPLPAGAQELITEMQQIQTQLGSMQERAMQDPALRAAGDSLGLTIRQAMEEVEPETPTLIARLNDLGPEVEAAQAAQDQDRYRVLITEATEINQILEIAQENAIERPDILARVDAYEEKVQSRMKADNPTAAELLERLEELNGQLAAMLQQAR
jgi:hypothetical protein